MEIKRANICKYVHGMTEVLEISLIMEEFLFYVKEFGTYLENDARMLRKFNSYSEIFGLAF